MSDAMKYFRKLSPEEQFQVLSNGGRYYGTVGELKAALADVPDDTQIAMRGAGGGEWVRGVVLSDRDLIKYGEGADSLTLDADNTVFRGRKVGKTKKISALGFDTLGL